MFEQYETISYNTSHVHQKSSCSSVEKKAWTGGQGYADEGVGSERLSEEFMRQIHLLSSAIPFPENCLRLKIQPTHAGREKH